MTSAATATPSVATTVSAPASPAATAAITVEAVGGTAGAAGFRGFAVIQNRGAATLGGIRVVLRARLGNGQSVESVVVLGSLIAGEEQGVAAILRIPPAAAVTGVSAQATATGPVSSGFEGMTAGPAQFRSDPYAPTVHTTVGAGYAGTAAVTAICFDATGSIVGGGDTTTQRLGVGQMLHIDIPVDASTTPFRCTAYARTV